MYNSALPNTEQDNGVNRYICKQVYDKSSMPELIAWIEFNQDKMESITGLPLRFRVHNACYSDNAVQAISVEGSDYAYTADTTLNPIITAKRQHAIYLKFFSNQSSAERRVLFSNGDFYDNDALIIYLRAKHDPDSPHNVVWLLCMKVGG